MQEHRMLPKPAYLGVEHAVRFQDQSVAEAYRFHSPYPDELFDFLDRLLVDEPRTVLDVGSGTGDIARRMVDRVERVDAVDVSLQMIEQGKQQPNGKHPQLNWIARRIEEASLHPPYALITAGESLHWMEWEIVLPYFRTILTPHGSLAIMTRREQKSPWHEPLLVTIRHFSTSKAYRPFDMIEELTQRHLFRTQGTMETEPVAFTQSVDDYIEHFHSMSSFSREHMGLEQASAFDREVRALIAPYVQDGLITRSVFALVTWGKPGFFAED